MMDMTEPHFEVVADDPTGETLVAGFTSPGVAGLSVVDDLVTGDEFEQIGHVSIDGFPSMTPLSDSAPRHPVRLYAGAVDGVELTVLVSELFLPVWTGEPFLDGLVEWLDTTSLAEVVVPYGIPFPHDEEGHVVSSAATPEFRERRLAETEIPPLPGGFVDGVVSELLLYGLEASDFDSACWSRRFTCRGRTCRRHSGFGRRSRRSTTSISARARSRPRPRRCNRPTANSPTGWRRSRNSRFRGSSPRTGCTCRRRGSAGAGRKCRRESSCSNVVGATAPI